MPESWSRTEVEAIVSDYFSMLASELKAEPYNKTRHRKNLMRLLQDRSEGSVERKHQNISAVMLELGYPYIPGYKPLHNYQGLLLQVVSDRLELETNLTRYISHEVDETATAPEVGDILDRLVPPPTRPRREGGDPFEHTPAYVTPLPRKPADHFAREARNASLGLAGEKFVVQFERERLRREGKSSLAERVEHVAQTRGDGLGFDVLSFDPGGKERLIEVKTTRYAIQTPFYVTLNELEVSRDRSQEFHLYRVFEFKRSPRLFSLRGPLDKKCTLLPVQFRGTVP